MEIEITASAGHKLAWLAGLVVLSLLVALALLGRAVTPVESGGPVLLAPERWQAYTLARMTRHDLLRLQEDALALQKLLDAPHLDPLAAQLLAQRIYARQQQAQGSTVTSAARLTLVDAARLTVLVAAGAEPRQKAIETYNLAEERIRLLAASDQQPAAKPGGGGH